MIFTVISWVLSLLGVVGILSIGPATGFGIFFIVKRSKEADEEKKKALLKKGIILLLLPWALVFGSLILFVILNTIKTLLINQ